MLKENTLVSVVVVTYNSSKTVIETLDSIYNQTYQNIELIISDDCSKDDSVKLCEEWVCNHRDRFVRTMIITVPTNTGTAGNINRALHETKGIWMKGIAADDRLLPNCIETFMNHIAKHPQQRIIFAKIKGFGNMEAAEKWPYKDVKWLFDNLSFKEMKIRLTLRNFLPAPSVFIKMDVFREIGFYDESMPLIEDWPFWIKAVFHNIPLYFCDEYVAEYRFSETSISQEKESFSPAFSDSYEKAKEYAYSHLSLVGKMMHFYVWTLDMDKKYKGAIWIKLLHFVNRFNPDYHKLKQARNKFHFFLYQNSIEHRIS